MVQRLEIENLSASELLGAIKSLTNEVQSLRNEVANNQNPTGLVEGDFMTAKATAKILNINDTSLWAWTRKGILQKYRIGKRVYYKRSEVETLLNSSKVGV